MVSNRIVAGDVGLMSDLGSVALLLVGQGNLVYRADGGRLAEFLLAGSLISRLTWATWCQSFMATV